MRTISQLDPAGAPRAALFTLAKLKVTELLTNLQVGAHWWTWELMCRSATMILYSQDTHLG